VIKSENFVFKKESNMACGCKANKSKAVPKTKAAVKKVVKKAAPKKKK
jgi:hypothetical protein